MSFTRWSRPITDGCHRTPCKQILLLLGWHHAIGTFSQFLPATSTRTKPLWVAALYFTDRMIDNLAQSEFIAYE